MKSKETLSEARSDVQGQAVLNSTGSSLNVPRVAKITAQGGMDSMSTKSS